MEFYYICFQVNYIKINKGDVMKIVLAALVASLLTSLAFAGPDCTKEPKDKWQNQDAFQKNLVAEGYKIKVFKVTKGNCYEIYGWDKAGKKVEIYYNPVDGSKVKEEIK
jgi:hypothetical protein